MVEKHKRSTRRWNKQKKKLRIAIAKYWMNPFEAYNSGETPQSCSSYCCGNPRRHEKSRWRLTMQELRSLTSE